MLQTPSRTVPTCARVRGFALIIALMLMVLLVLLMTSLTSLVRVDLQTSGSGDNLQIARQNALLGLKVAIAELQTAAGPDQRSTARADITSASTVANPHWTGVWQSTPPSTAPYAKPVVPTKANDAKAADSNLAPSQVPATPLNWLVSGNEQKIGQPTVNPADSLTNSVDFGQDATKKAVYLVGASTLVGKGADESASGGLTGAVIAPKVPVTGEGSDKTGYYAWWVGDEGVKARVQKQPESLSVIGQNPTQNANSAFHLPASTDPAVIADLEAFFDRKTDNLGDLSDFDSLQLLMVQNNDAGQRLALNKHWHDLSPFSRGLLTDTRWGGLRGDLTLAFENSNIFTKYFGNWNTNRKNFYFIDLDEFPAYSANFLNWSNLRNFYNLKDRSGIGTGTITSGMAAPLDSTRAVYAQEATNPYKNTGSQAREVYHSNSPVHPLLSRLQTTLGIRFQPTTPPAGSTEPHYAPVILVKPLVGFYNPYNVQLDPPTGTDQNIQIRWSFLPLVTIKVYDADGVAKAGFPNGVKFYLREVLAAQGGSARDDLTMAMPAANYQPGEQRLFGLWDNVSRANITADNNQLRLATGSPATYDPEKGFFILSLDNAFAATSDGETADYASGNTKFGLTPAEKAYLSIKGDESFELTINSSAPGGVWHAASASIDGISTPNRHIQFFSPVADKTNSNVTKEESTGRIGVNGAIVAAPTDPGAFDNLITWGFWMRGAEDSLASNRLLVDNNIRALTGPWNWDSMNENFYLSSIFTGEFEGQQLYGFIDDPLANIINLTDSRFTGYTGGSASSQNGGVSRVVLFDVPRSPLLSLGALQHANIGRYTIDPTYIIGNSFPPARLEDLDNIRSSGYIRTGIDIWDLSYLLNQQLWDSYYFSGIPTGIEATDIEALLKNSQQLPNHRLRLHSKRGTPTKADLTNNSSDTGSHTFYDVASYLTVDGAFNINSTSEEAWAAFLASSRNLQIPLYNPDTGAYLSTQEEENTVFSRLMHPVDGNDNFWRGYRALNETQIRALAKEIVSLIRARGKPFGSLADFVNRPLDNSGKPGLLQQAIDATTINNGTPGGILSGIPNPQGISHNQMNGTAATVAFPGFLTQADILQALGPLLSARSDTFTIRSYGDAVNPQTNKVEARAWCEAVVQRVPHETLDGADPLSRSASRKFRVVSFRWLTKEEI